MRCWAVLLLALFVALQVGCSPIAGAPPRLDLQPSSGDGLLALPESVDEHSEEDPAIDSILVQDDFAIVPAKDMTIPPNLKEEAKMRKLKASTRDGRESMKAKKCDSLDGDCDSFQQGELEQWPIGASDVKMDKTAGSIMKEQPSAREVLLDQKALMLASVDDPAAAEGDVEQADPPMEIDPVMRSLELPAPDAEEERKSKCSKWRNGHDAPDALDSLDDDCGMPEPLIPCETPGNTTGCVPRIQLEPPSVPEAELMPPVPAPGFVPPGAVQYTNISVEFVDLGISQTTEVSLDIPVGQAIAEAGAEFGLDGAMVQLARSGGVDLPMTTWLRKVPDRSQLVVYLKCCPRTLVKDLIMPVPACEDMTVRNFTARVEVPVSHAVYDTTVLSTGRVGSVLISTPIALETIEKITYDGNEVSLDTPLEEIFFRDDSAFVVYLPCPSHSPSISLSPSATSSPSVSPSPTHQSPSPLPYKLKNRKMGAYDAYRHCRNARGARVQPPDPESIGLDPNAVDPQGKGTKDDFECEGSDMTDLEAPDLSNLGDARKDIPGPDGPHDVPRTPMVHKVVIEAEYDGRVIPVLVKPVSRGIDIFDAVQRATGKTHENMEAIFLGKRLDHYTELKPLGFRDGDKVTVMSLVKKAGDKEDDKEE